jgi:protein gp37
MGDKTGIEWTDATWNPVRGCSRVSEGCRHCYAERVAARFAGPGKPYEGLAKVTAPRDLLDRVGGRRNGWTGEVRLIAERLADPLRRKKPRRIFVNSMSDLFHEKLTNEQIAAVFGVMAAAPHHTFQVLTKRAKRLREWFAWATRHGDGHDLMRFGPSALITCAWEACSGDAWEDLEPPEKLGSIPSADIFGTTWPLPNVWLGVSVENQAAADERIPELLATPAAVRFLSCEPLIGPVDLEHIRHSFGHGPSGESYEITSCLEDDDGFGLNAEHARIDWVITGCESGPGARPCDVAWLRSLRDQCASARVPFFLKQARPVLGEYTITDIRPVPVVEGRQGELIPVVALGPGSKRKAGGVIALAYLDGVQHAASPKVA